MANGGHWTVLLLLCTIPGSIFAKERGVYRQKDAADSPVQAPPAGLSVLLLTTGDAGHVIVMATLGVALVQRGHRVTLSTPLREGNTRPQDLAEKYGMGYESNGVDPHPTQEAVLNHHAYLHENGFLVNAYDAAWYASRHSKLASDFLNRTHERWDVVVVDIFASLGPICVSQTKGFRVVLLTPSLSPCCQPSWPYPHVMGAYSDNLTFFQRLVTFFMQVTWSITAEITFLNSILPGIECETSALKHGFSGATVPQILTHTMGFEFPRPLPPLVHPVGPLVVETDAKLPQELENWLRSKSDASVVYVSMGSAATLTKEMGQSILQGVMHTNYSVIWSLRNRGILEDLEIDTERFFIHGWLPQPAILKHPTVAMAVVHGGMGGVTEALFYAVPLIVIPFGMDQLSTATRVEHFGAGIVLDKDSLSSGDIAQAIETVRGEDYKNGAERIQKTFLLAGGVDRAAELVEFYGEVGYGHLAPSFARYQWSWVQYYNVDVYALLLAAALLWVYLSVRLSLCLCRRCCACCRSTNKKKTE